MQTSKSLFNPKLHRFYTEKQAIREEVGTSRSPMKPYLLMNRIRNTGLFNSLEIHSGFSPFENEEILVAHHRDYIENYFAGMQ